MKISQIISENEKEFEEWLEERLKTFVDDFNSCVESEERGDTLFGIISDTREEIFSSQTNLIKELIEKLEGMKKKSCSCTMDASDYSMVSKSCDCSDDLEKVIDYLKEIKI